MELQIQPSTLGAFSSTISISSNDPSQPVFSFQVIGTAVASPESEIHITQGTSSIASGGNYDFGSVVVGSSSATITFTIQNLGTANLNLTGSPFVAISGTDASEFTVTQPTSASISPSGSETFTVQFSPTSVGSKIAMLTILNNDSDEGTYTINLLGVGSVTAVPEINITDGISNIPSGSNYDFGTVTATLSSSPVTFYIENLGTADLLLTGMPKVAISGVNASEFSINQTATTSPITSGTSVSFEITFSPTTGGAKTATITISNNDSDEGTYTINLTGTGLAPEINLRQGGTNIAVGGTYDFGSVSAGSSSASITFTIENLGIGDLSLTGTPLVSISGSASSDFIINSYPVLTTIPSSGSTTFSITFSPSQLGTRTATLQIMNDDADEGEYTITLTGTGTASLAEEINILYGSTSILSGGYFDMGNIVNGSSSANFTLTIENQGLAPLNLTGTPKVSISADGSIPGSSNFTVVSQPTSPVIIGFPKTFTIKFSPNAIGLRGALLTIANNDSDEGTYTIRLRGYGLSSSCTLSQSPDVPDKLTYVTTASYKGNFGGTSGADSICNSDANKPAGKTFKAILGASNRSATNNWVLFSNTRYFLTSGNCTTKTDASALITYNLKTAFGGTRYFTGLNADQSLHTKTCNNWTTTSGKGRTGNGSQTGNKSVSDKDQSCNTAYSLLCAEQ